MSLEYKPVKKIDSDSDIAQGNVMPYDKGIEVTVIATLLSFPDALLKTKNILHKQIFYVTQHQVLFEAIAGLFIASQQQSASTIYAYLVKHNKASFIGGMDYISSILKKETDLDGIEYNCKVLQELYVKRKNIEFLKLKLQESYDEDVNPLDIITDMEAHTLQIHGEINSSETESMEVTIDNVINELESQSELQIMPGISFGGFTDVDEIIGKLQDGTLNIIAARPGMAKTALALQVAYYVAHTLNLPVVFFSLEMSKKKLIQRLIANIFSIELDTIKKRLLSKQQIADIRSRLKGCLKNLTILDESTLKVAGLRSDVLRLIKEKKIRMVVIDYLQLMEGSNNKGNREGDISEISRKLKNLSKEVQMPIIALSQLSREVEKRKGNRPQLSDLRESGAIEQDADMVMFIYRPEYYDEPVDLPGTTELIIAKNRDGKPRKNALLQFQGEFQRFKIVVQTSIDYSQVAEKLDEDVF